MDIRWFLAVIIAILAVADLYFIREIFRPVEGWAWKARWTGSSEAEAEVNRPGLFGTAMINATLATIGLLLVGVLFIWG